MHNTLSNINGTGISAYGNGNNLYYNNTVTNFSWYGMEIISNYQNLTGNVVQSGGGSGPTPSGFYIQASNSTLRNNTARNVSGDGFTSGGSRENTTYTGNLAYNNSGDGFDFNTVHAFVIANNSAHDNSGEGYYIHATLGGSDHHIFNNSAENNSLNGFHLSYEPRHTIEFNYAFNNSLSGFLLNASQNCNLSNNTALDNQRNGFEVTSDKMFGLFFNSSDYTRLLDNNASGNGMAGLAIINSSSNFIDPSYLCDNVDGLVIFNSTNVTVQDNVLCNNTGTGLNLSQSNVTLAGNSFYNNGHDLSVEGQSIYNMSGSLFLNPLGTLANYTNLSVNDSVASSAYTINWTVNSSALPADYLSFEQKFLNISTVSGTPSIDSIVWSWTDTEAGSYEESKLELWKWNGSWSDTGATLSTGSNSLSLTSMNPASDYGILEYNGISNNITDCLLINAPGSYQLTADLVGAPIDASEAVYLNWACIKIASGDVHIDCNGHTITNNGTADAGAIVANTSASVSYTNISLRNCPSIADYEIGVHAQYLESSALDNLVVTNSTDGSFTGFGLLLSYSVDTNVTDNTISDSIGYGMRLRSGERNIISGNEISGSGYSDFEIGSTDGLISDNIAHGGDNGFTFISGTNNTIRDNLAYNHSSTGFDTNTANSQFINNTAHESGDGFYVSGYNSNFTNSSSYNNSGDGFYIREADEITLENFHLYANEYDLHWHAYNGVEDVYARNVTFDNPQGGFANYTWLDFNASLDASIQDREVSFNWTSNSSALPLNYTSFEQKFVSITNHTPGVTIDSIAWRWYDSESLIYNESRLQLWNWNGTDWTDTGATLDTGANSLSLSSMDPAGDYGILHNGSIGDEATLVGAQVNETKHGRYNESSYAGNASTAGGNFTNLNMNTSQLSERWAALYGTFDNTILLSDAAGINNVYSWIWNASAGGVVCVSTNDSLYNFTVFPATPGDIDSAWSFTPTASDSAANTFTGSNCTLDIGATSIPNSAYADTGSAGGYITCAVKTKPVPTKPNLAFCAEIEEDGPIWNGDSGDFEIIVPTPIGIGSTETYFFYVNLD
jgi:parallel beta-helix repeat protein